MFRSNLLEFACSAGYLKIKVQVQRAADHAYLVAINQLAIILGGYCPSAPLESKRAACTSLYNSAREGTPFQSI